MRFAAVELSDVIDVDEAVDLDAARALVAGQGVSPDGDGRWRS
jgi:hypothetical protein